VTGMAQPVAGLALPFRHPAVLLATWFGVGFLPRAPGTWGSLAALPLAWIVSWGFGPTGLFVAVVLIFGFGWWATAIIARAGGASDPGAVVVDEVAGQCLALVAAPRDLLLYVVGFLLFRAADIFKPWPASWADRTIHGGLGIMLDDIFAALWVVAALLLIMRFGIA
jgi:phosphatidylglycerophosphatase A